MFSSRPVSQLSLLEQINFLITNRIPRRTLTRFMGWFSKIKNPWLTRVSIRIWQLFADDLRLDEAKQDTFVSLHECFVRELKDGARMVDRSPNVLTSPCDAVLGAYGDIEGCTLVQAKGFTYTLDELLGDSSLVANYRDGRFATLRLKSSMYHRFHAPLDCTTREVVYISGDTWNVNPVALKKVERLFCRNERAVIELDSGEDRMLLVPVAAVLVASIRLAGLDVPLNLRYRGANRLVWRHAFAKGDQMGYFEHGSTIILLTSRRCRFDDRLVTGDIVRMGQGLMTIQKSAGSPSHCGELTH